MERLYTVEEKRSGQVRWSTGLRGSIVQCRSTIANASPPSEKCESTWTEKRSLESATSEKERCRGCSSRPRNSDIWLRGIVARRTKRGT